MFKELEPILEKRALTLTIARLPKSNLICVTVVPTQTDEDKDIDTASLVPLKLDPATAEDLDSGLVEALTSHASTFLSMQESVDQAKANMEAALQAAKDEAKKKADEAKKVSTTVKPATNSKAVTPKEDPPPPEPTKVPSLFDAPSSDAPGETAAKPESTPVTLAPEANPAGSASAAAKPADDVIPSTQSTEDEILAEVKAADGQTQSNSVAA